MARDSEIEAIFTVADDAMQGLWALHMYIKAATDLIDGQTIVRSLPEKAFQLTHEWVRLYDPQELVRAIQNTGIDFLLSRASLVSLVTILEGAVAGMRARLEVLKKCQSGKLNNKGLLSWAFDLVKDTESGSRAMLQRLPDTCADLDGARRLRNCIVHQNGKYDSVYFQDELKRDWFSVKSELDAPDKSAVGRVIQLTTPRYEHFSRSHIEFLHILHNTIQTTFFGYPSGYNYREEGKTIEWRRVLTGSEGT